jgi:hypothetical protein
MPKFQLEFYVEGQSHREEMPCDWLVEALNKVEAKSIFLREFRSEFNSDRKVFITSIDEVLF